MPDPIMPPPPGPAIPPPGSRAAAIILRWLIDLINKHQQKPPANPPAPPDPGMAELEAYRTALLAANVQPAAEIPS